MASDDRKGGDVSVTIWVAVLGVIVALAAAVRSSWSPCGRSMLSSITPIGERGRGNRYGATATGFVIGGLVGGACLGGLIAEERGLWAPWISRRPTSRRSARYWL